MRITLWTLAAALASLGPTVASAQGPAVAHVPVGCVVAQQFPVLSARIDPAASVARARVFFRADGGRHWYFVEMRLQGGAFQGTLPRPRKGTARIQYYIEALDTAAASARTPDYTPAVARSRAECSRGMAVASMASVPSVVAVSAPPGAPLVPAGFEANGIVAAAGAAGAAGAAAATVAAGAGGGGIGTAAVVVGGVVVAGGAAAAVTLGRGDDGGGGGGDGGGGDGGGRCGTVAITDRTATTLTVTWSGGQPTDGKYIVDGGRVAAGSVCTVLAHELPSIVVQATSFVITGLSPATTYSVHVHPAGTVCPNCDTGYNLTDTVGAAVATTLGP